MLPLSVITFVAAELCAAEEGDEPPHEDEQDGDDSADGVQRHAEPKGTCLYTEPLLGILKQFIHFNYRVTYYVRIDARLIFFGHCLMSINYCESHELYKKNIKKT